MKSVNLEKLNRKNFRSMMDAMSMPGELKKITSLYDSNLLAVANVLLYSEATFFHEGKEDMSIIEAITNTKKESIENADYIFSNSLDVDFVKKAKKGDFVNPDYSAMLIFTCRDFNKTKVLLSGPGVDSTKEVFLPCNENFIESLKDKNSEFPLGIEVCFINDSREFLALSRTTKIEVL